MIKLLFITTANLSTNPRLYKEMKLAESLGYKVSFVAFRQGGWSDEKDKVLIEDIKGHNHYLSALRKPFLPWLISSILNKICIWIWPHFKKNLLVATYALNKRGYLLHRYLKGHRGDYNLVIGHNLGVLYPVYRFAKRKSIPFAFDVEDYHPGEASAYTVGGEVERRKFLMSSLLSDAVYFSYASPLIGSRTSDLVSSFRIPQRILINNCFSKNEFRSPEKVEGPLRLVWFSQNINKGRGLEWMLPVLDNYKKEFRLTLIGALNNSFYEEHLIHRGYINVVAPLSQRALNLSLSQYDAGLALELNGADENRQLCLTNKIWAYLQSGLYIVATDTPAQKIFMSEFASHGRVTGQSPESFKAVLEHLIQHKNEIREAAQYRYENAQDVTWEIECKKLQNTWQEILLRDDLNPPRGGNLRQVYL